jgi:pectin methylesterase-like acyl-CoA thioesterase
LYALFLGMASLFIFSPLLLAQGNTITVCASGCDYSTIQDAVDNANPDDTIQLAAETFTTPLLLTKKS